MENNKNIINDTVKQVIEHYSKDELIFANERKTLPSRDEIIDILQELQQVIFPGFFNDDEVNSDTAEFFAGSRLVKIYDSLKKQIETALAFSDETSDYRKDVQASAAMLCDRFFSRLGYIQDMLSKDIIAEFDGDPAANSKEEVVFCYPGLFAIYVYRVAHELYAMDIPLIPRIMSEYVHGKTGIDINPGAVIGEYFFIDHGTGIVIGETTEIGNNVKLYQGVTLGALSTRQGQRLSGKKRHPTIGNNVTIYSNASILGGETVIGDNCVIGGNTFITSSIPEGTKVVIMEPEMIYIEADGAE